MITLIVEKHSPPELTGAERAACTQALNEMGEEAPLCDVLKRAQQIVSSQKVSQKLYQEMMREAFGGTPTVFKIDAHWGGA